MKFFQGIHIFLLNVFFCVFPTEKCSFGLACLVEWTQKGQ